MGRFVNPDNSAFQVALNSKIHIDVQWLKKIGWLIWIMALLPCLAMAQSPGDDVYFVPKKQKDDKKTEKVTAKSAGDVLNATQKKGNGVGTVVVRDYTGRTRDTVASTTAW